MCCTQELFLNEISTPEQVASFSLILEEVAIALGCVRPHLAFDPPSDLFCIQFGMVFDQLRPIPERQRKSNGLFNELGLRERHRMLRNGELPIDILKLIGQCNLSSRRASAKPSEFLDETFCGLFAELDKFDEQGKQRNNDVRLFLASSLGCCNHGLLLCLFFTKPTRQLGQKIGLPDHLMPFRKFFNVRLLIDTSKRLISFKHVEITTGD